MAKKTAKRSVGELQTSGVSDLECLARSIQTAHQELAQQASRAVNVSLTVRNWVIGHYIAEYELNGADRATYGDRLLERLAVRLRSNPGLNLRKTSTLPIFAVLPHLPGDCAVTDRTIQKAALKQQYRPRDTESAVSDRTFRNRGCELTFVHSHRAAGRY